MRLQAVSPSPHLKHTFSSAWGYIRHELLYVTWSLMEIAILTPVVLGLLRWARYWPPSQVALWLTLLILLPFNLVRLFSLLGLPKEMQRNMMVFALLATAFISIRTTLHDPQSWFDFRWFGDFYRNLAEEGNQLWTRDILLFSLTCFVWWRGLRLLNRDPDIHRAGLRFRVGSFILIPLMIMVGTEFLQWTVLPFVLFFFVAGLTAVALIRAEQLEFDKTGLAPSLTPRWVSSISATAVGVTFIAALFAIFFSGQTPAVLSAWIDPIRLAGSFGFWTISLTIARVAEPILKVLIWLFELFISAFGRLFARAWQSLQLRLPDLATPEMTPEATPTPEALQTTDGTKIVVILLMIAVVLLVTLALSRLYKQAVTAARDSDRVDELSTEQDERPGLARRLLERLGLWRDWRTAASIRRIYQQMCRAASGAGYPRSTTETPYEYLDTLTKVWPSNTGDAQLITTAYVKIRYGELPETQSELDEIKAAWQRLETTKPTELTTELSET
jgi:hypothetical protein